jgi:hypothetical protein
MSKTAAGLRAGYSSRAERFEDGSLVDVSKEARAARFLVPVALTAELYADAQDLSGEYVLSGDTAQSRLQGLLQYARAHVSKHLEESWFTFSLYLPIGERTTYQVRLSLGPGDQLENVITLSKVPDQPEMSKESE